MSWYGRAIVWLYPIMAFYFCFIDFFAPPPSIYPPSQFSSGESMAFGWCWLLAWLNPGLGHSISLSPGIISSVGRAILRFQEERQGIQGSGESAYLYPCPLAHYACRIDDTHERESRSMQAVCQLQLCHPSHAHDEWDKTQTGRMEKKSPSISFLLKH